MKRGFALVLLILQPMLFYRSVLVKATRHIPYDINGFHTPLADYISWSLRQGRFPMWDPNPYCGYPIHADVQAQLFYPPAWLAFLARNLTRPETTFYWLEWLVALHMMLAGMLTFWLLRKRGCSVPAAYLAGVVFQLGAFFASQAQHLGAICGAAWMPLAWLAVLELRKRFSMRWFAILALALALTFLAGFTAVTLVAFFSTVVVLAASRPRPIAFLWVALAMAAVVPLVAVQLFPSIDLANWSVASLRAAWGQGAGTPARAWMSFLWPNYHGVFHPFDPKVFHDDYQFTLLYCYSGMAAVLGCVAALFRRGDRVWVLLAALFAILQCGNRLPGFETFFHLLPGFVRGSFYADFLLAAACLAIAVACGMAFSRLPDRWVWVAALATAVELTWVGSDRPMNTDAGTWKQVTSESNISGDRQLPRTLESLVGQSVPQDRLDVLNIDYTFTMGASLRRLPTPNGDNPFASLAVIELRRLFAKGAWWERQLPVAKAGSPLLEFLNVRLLIADSVQENPAEMAEMGWNRIEGGQWLRLYAKTRVQPRFFFVDRVREAETGQRSLELVQSIDLRHEAVVEGSVGPIGPAGDVKVVRYEPDTILLDTDSEAAGFLVTSESHHPGWKATVDGSAEPILVTNHAFRGLRVPAGQHRVEMRYRPAWFVFWAALSAGGWLIFLVCAVRKSRGGESSELIAASLPRKV